MDYATLLIDPIYGVFGVDAVLTLGDTAETEAAVTVIDKTAGVDAGDNVPTGTLLPGAVIRVSDLTAHSLTRADLDGASVTFSGNTWRIASHFPKPVPSGEAQGEIMMILELDNG